MLIDARKPEGNAFGIMAVVRDLLMQADRSAEWPAVQKRMMEGNYDHLCDVAEEVSFGSIKVIGREGDEEED